MSLWSRMICPHCFERFRISQAPFRCENTDVRLCPLEPDEVYGRFLGNVGKDGSIVIPKMRKVIPSRNGSPFARLYVPNEVRCPKCGFRTRTRICPACHSELPPVHGNVKNQIIAVVGSRASGKSNYIGVVINQLRRRYAPDLLFTLRALGDDTADRYKAVYYSPIFEQRTVLAPTTSIMADPRVRIPLVYRLEFRKGYTIRGINMVLFDTAGEDMNKQRIMGSPHYRYIVSASAIIFLINPLNFDAVQHQMDKDLPSGMIAEGAQPDEIVDHFVNIVGLPPGRKIPIPVVFAFTKCDMLRNIVDRSTTFMKDSYHDGAFNRSEFNEADEEVRSHLAAWGQRDLINKVDMYFKHYAFAAISSFGGCPTKDLRINSISPVRVGDPFLWILWKLGYLRAE